jgi:hypothetical protein
MENYEHNNIDKQVNEGFAALAPVEQAKMDEARGLIEPLDDDIKGLFADFERNTSEAHAASATLLPQLQKLRTTAQSALFPPTPAQLVAEAQKIEQASTAEVESRIQAALTAGQMIEPLLFSRAIPSLKDPQERNDAVREVEMLTAGLSGLPLVVRLGQIARGPDRRHAAVVASTWGKAKLGGDQAGHDTVVRQALQGSLEHGSESEKKHAKAYGELPMTASKVLAIARTRTRERLRGRPI